MLDPVHKWRSIGVRSTNTKDKSLRIIQIFIGHAPLWCKVPVRVVKMVPWTLWVGVLRTLKGLLIYSCSQLQLSHPFWSTHFLTSSWYPHLLDFGANLVPTCLPKWSQNRSKIDPRAVHHPSQHPSCHRYNFSSIWGAFFVDFSMFVRPWNHDFLKTLQL